MYFDIMFDILWYNYYNDDILIHYDIHIVHVVVVLLTQIFSALESRVKKKSESESRYISFQNLLNKTKLTSMHWLYNNALFEIITMRDTVQKSVSTHLGCNSLSKILSDHKGLQIRPARRSPVVKKWREGGKS